MFSKFRTGAKKAGGRRDRHGGRQEEGARTKPPLAQGHGDGLYESKVSDRAPSEPGTGLVSSSAPTLPPIPRVASQHESQRAADDIQESREIELAAKEAIKDEADSAISGVGQLGGEEPSPPHPSSEGAEVRYKAGKESAHAALMPPPARPAYRGSITSLGSQAQSATDLSQVYMLSQAGKRPASSRASSGEQIPPSYRLQEPEDWVHPRASHERDSSPNPHPRPKSRLGKLNPLSYLSRRKNSSPAEEVNQSVLLKRASFTPAAPLSDDFDPRIKGKGVHDFSAPRPSHFTSVQNLRSAAAEEEIAPPPSGIYADVRRGSDSNLLKRPLGDPSPERRHLPVFKEDFSDENDGFRLNPDDRRNQSSTSIVDKVAELETAQKEDGARRSRLPAFAANMPEELPPAQPEKLMHTPQPARLTPQIIEPEQPTTPNSIQKTPDSLKFLRETPLLGAASPASQSSPLADRSRTASPDASGQFSSLPKHMRKSASIKSQASRFSFDMVGGAQERLLEEKHRQRAAQRARATSLTGASINEEDDFNEDDLDYDEGLEEDIPGMNDDEYDFGRQNVANMTLDVPQEEYGDEYPGLDDDDEDEFGTDGVAGGGLGNMTLENFKSPEAAPPIQPRAVDGAPRGLGLSTGMPDQVQASTVLDSQEEGGTDVADDADDGPRTVSAMQNRIQESINDLSNDGFYFDDGEFNDEDFGDELGAEGDFDESILDQEFRRGKLINGLKQAADGEAPANSSTPSTRPNSFGSEQVVDKRLSEVTADTSRTSMQFAHARRSSAYGQHSDFEASAGLTRENLSAYHDALAFATNQAAAQGRFHRKSSNHTDGSTDAVREAVGQRISFDEPTFARDSKSPENSSSYNQADDDFDFDDSIDDDAIIAAANAEALENDEEDFYGSEFGFYAHANGSQEAESYHGGFFGPAGMIGVKRSHSGREAFQEPSLTPITERSEWSNRNSMISLAMHGAGISPGAVTSPGSLPIPTSGLTQLADQIQQEGSPGEDMSLGALMKARRGAFGAGGSSTSLHSAGASGSRSGSPSLYAYQQQRVSPFNGSFAAPPSVPEEGFVPDLQPHQVPNPILTLQTQNLSLRPTTGGSSDSSPLKRSSARPGHSRTSSGAESVSYAIEKDEDGGNMWVLEKRRTLDNGEMEILGREVIKGGI